MPGAAMWLIPTCAAAASPPETKPKCPERYTREEVLEKKFGELLSRLQFDDEVIGWVSEALLQSHAEEKKAHEEAIARLQAEYTRLQARLDAMYVDKLDGKIDGQFFESKSADWRREQQELLASIQKHQSANQKYFEQGLQLLELARRAHDMYQRRTAREKRQLLNFVLSNSTWKHGELTAQFRQPFDMIALAAADNYVGSHEMRGGTEQNKNWLLR